jgi:GTPase SAR1 family protein
MGLVRGLAMTADGRRAVSCTASIIVRLWELPPYDVKATKEVEATRYTNAKVLLVGETGVGKSGLAYRLTEDRFVPTISTDGAWATQLKLPEESSNEEIEREIWLWDFAGQADYRLIHRWLSVQLRLRRRRSIELQLRCEENSSSWTKQRSRYLSSTRKARIRLRGLANGTVTYKRRPADHLRNS